MKTDLLTVLGAIATHEEPWSIHVDELTQWGPARSDLASWFVCAGDLLLAARNATGDKRLNLICFSLEPSVEVNIFKDEALLDIDFFTPPVLYSLPGLLEFPTAVECYMKAVRTINLSNTNVEGALLLRSARTRQGEAAGWEFDNSAYLVQSNALTKGKGTPCIDCALGVE